MKTTANNSFTATAYNYSAVLASLVKAYANTSQLKKDYKSLVNLYGKDEAVRLMKGYKSAKAGEVSAKADEVRNNLTLAGVMEYAFGRLDKGKKSGALAKLCKMSQTERATAWESFLARFYPYTLADGKPATAVWYTKDGSECFKVYEPLKMDEDNAVKVLKKALANLERGAKRVWVSGKPRLTFTTVYERGVVQSVCQSKVLEVTTEKDGKVTRTSYTIERGETKDFAEGLKLTAEYVTTSEYCKMLAKEDE